MSVRARQSLRVRRVVPWAVLGLALVVSLATASLLLIRFGETASATGMSVLAPLIAALGLVTGGLVVALTRTQINVRKERRDGVLALQRGEALRAQLEQQGRTARKEAQERLALIDALFRATPAGLALFDRELNYVRVNQGLSDIHGLPAGAHLGKRLRELLPGLAPGVEKTLQDVLSSGEARTIELSGRTASSGTTRTWLVNCAPVRDADTDVVGVAEVVMDITERKQAEHETRKLVEALRAEREVFDVVHRVGQRLAAELNVGRLAQALADAAAQLSSAEVSIFVYASQAGAAPADCALAGSEAKTLTGLNAEALLKVLASVTSPVRLTGLRPAERPEFATQLAEALASSVKFKSLIALPIVHLRGATNAALLVGHRQPAIFTERDQSVLAGLSTQAAIALENARLYGEAEGLIRALAQSNRELDQFAYVASHDLKAPLRGIANIANWLEEDLGEALPKRSREHLLLLRNRVSRLENMIGGILRYSRAGRREVARERVPVGELVNEVVTLLAPHEQATVKVAGELPILHTERVPLQQVFMNLIGNALKYAKRPDVVVEVGCREVDGKLEFSVRDNGPGIEPDDQPHIWELFQARSADSQSSGIGLAVVRKTVEARGGRAWVDSKPGQGSTFYFTWSVDA
ncbi:MAG: ATP-binding protein [Myxococcales bacterium]